MGRVRDAVLRQVAPQPERGLRSKGVAGRERGAGRLSSLT